MAFLLSTVAASKLSLKLVNNDGELPETSAANSIFTGKSNLINAFAKKGGAKVTKLTDASIPGTTLESQKRKKLQEMNAESLSGVST
ncbi:hypothetical protein JCGZ_22455 [Jatropha curcas]|uniref:Uncharacterized protein n=1 Tax=Jatropha curcas TaxID=180498 RepID=A0A067K373_JATCU|nr:hypothetical protein JCGZ_22455 [Jatropha curcas]